MTMPTMQRRSERGQEVAEFALIFMVLFFILMIIFDAGRISYYSGVLRNAAREGARYGVINSTDTDAIITYVRERVPGVPADEVSVAVTYPTDDRIQVTTEWNMTFVTPLIGNFFAGGTVPLGGVATMRIER